MDYQNYEEYMRSVLGYQNGNIYANTYTPRNDYYYDMPQMNYFNNNTESLNMFYPDIYKLIYPMVCKVCNQNMNKQITKELIEQMTDEIYINFESDDRQTVNNARTTVPLKNGDVRNPNAKEPEVRQEARQSNFLLRDLIKILILRELVKPNRPQFPQQGRPPMPPWRPY